MSRARAARAGSRYVCKAFGSLLAEARLAALDRAQASSSRCADGTCCQQYNVGHVTRGEALYGEVVAALSPDDDRSMVSTDTVAAGPSVVVAWYTFGQQGYPRAGVGRAP